MPLSPHSATCRRSKRIRGTGHAVHQREKIHHVIVALSLSRVENEVSLDPRVPEGERLTTLPLSRAEQLI